MTIKQYRETPYGVSDGVDPVTYRVEAEALLDAMGNWPAITRLEAEADWQTADAEGDFLPEPVYQGLAVRAYGESGTASTVETLTTIPDRMRAKSHPRVAYYVAKLAAESIDRKRFDDAYGRAREECERTVACVGPDVTPTMVAELVFRAGWTAARDFYRQ